MELTVFRQKSKTRPDGTVVYKGEDAPPLVGDTFFLVADGMGGAASIRHQRFDPALFDRDKLLDALFAGIFSDYSDERFAAYVTDSFFELYAVKDCYTENIYNVKKSGYFASRLVAAIFYHEMLSNRKLEPESLFALYNAQDSAEKKAQFLESLGGHFADTIRNNLRKIAAKVGLGYESPYAGLALLGTTLCATIFRETEDSVEAFYLTAGDSRPYVWTEAEGLCQLLPDQEREDGGMTNYIKANEDGTFEIRCDYFSFKKPCVLFNASDGCFDSGLFLSQMAFEKLLLDKAVEAQSAEGMGQSIDEAYITYGKHDDSNTLAMKFFGYESFEAFRESAGKRLEALNREYLAELPDLLERDYVAENREAAAKAPSLLAALKERFEKDEAVGAYCEQQVLNGRYPPYDEKRKALEAESARTAQAIDEAGKRIEALIARHYSEFSSLLPHKETWGEKRAEKRISFIDEKYRADANSYLALLDVFDRSYTSAAETMKAALEQISAIGIPGDYADYGELSFSSLEKNAKTMRDLSEFFSQIGKKRHPLITRISQHCEDFSAENRRLAAGHEAELHELREKLVSGEISAGEILTGVLKNDARSIDRELERIREAKMRLSALETDEKRSLLAACRQSYWAEHADDVIAALAADDQYPLSADLRADARTVLAEIDTQAGELEKKAELQTRLFRKYDETYYRYMKGQSV